MFEILIISVWVLITYWALGTVVFLHCLFVPFGYVYLQAKLLILMDTAEDHMDYHGPVGPVLLLFYINVVLYWPTMVTTVIPAAIKHRKEQAEKQARG